MTWNTLFERAYTPYSSKPCAVVVKGSEGTLFPGVRIESASFPSSIPAIQAACTFCLSEGETPEVVYITSNNPEQLPFWTNEFNLKVEHVDTPPTGTYFEPLVQINDTLTTLKVLLEKAIVTHSDFPVSAVLHIPDGYICGVNVEVSDWTMGLCAERVAIAKAVSSGYSEFKDMAIHTRYGSFSSPCGNCRQVISEHMPLNPLVLYHPDGSTSRHLTADLLPFSFTSKNLKK